MPTALRPLIATVAGSMPAARSSTAATAATAVGLTTPPAPRPIAATALTPRAPTQINRNPGLSFEARVAAALTVRAATQRELCRYIGGVCPRGPMALAWPGNDRVLVTATAQARSLVLYGFIERSPPTKNGPGTYEGRGATHAAVAEITMRGEAMPVPALLRARDGGPGTAALAIHAKARDRFSEAAGLASFRTADGAVELSGNALVVRMAALAPWLHPSAEGGNPFSATAMAAARAAPEIGPRLWYLPSRRRFLFLDGPGQEFAADAAEAGLTPVQGSAGAHQTESPAAARRFAAFADGLLARTLQDLAERWPFGFIHLTCADVAAELPGGAGGGSETKAEKRGRAAAPIGFDPGTQHFVAWSAEIAATLGLPELPPRAAAAIAARLAPGTRRRAAWGFPDDAQALHWRRYLDDEAEGELMCRLVQASTGPRLPDGTGLPPQPAPPTEYDQFQLDGIRHAMRGHTIAISDDMGTGKTYQGVGLADRMRLDRGIAPTSILVIAPADQLNNWTRKLTCVPSVPFDIVRLDPGSRPTGIPAHAVISRERKTLRDPMRRTAGQGEALIVSFETVTSCPWLAVLAWDLILIDEAHNLKTPGSARNLALLGAPGSKPKLDCTRMVWMTGTDITDTIMDYYPFLSTAVWRSGAQPTPPARFKEIFNPKTRATSDAKAGGTDATFEDNAAIDLIRTRRVARLAAAMDAGPRIRRLKEHVYANELIPKASKPWLVPITDPAVLDDARREGEAWDAIVGGLGFEERKAAVRDLSTRRMRTALAKIPYVVRAVSRVARPDDPILLYAHHTAAADAMGAALRAAGIDCVVAHGKNTTPTARAEVAEAFEAGRWTVLVTTIMGMYSGHTMVRTRHVWFLELDHKGRHIEQCIDRAWRRGQKRAVRARFFHVAGSYDGRIAAGITRKAGLADIAGGDDRRRMAGGEP